MINQIGQLFITGYEGGDPSDEFLEFFSMENIGGVILFERNCAPHNKAEENIKKIVAVSKEIPFIAVDQEGGRVCRFKGAPAEYDAAEEYGRKNDVELFAEQFQRSAYYIRSLGVNLLLGPVADLRLNEMNHCLADRTFGKTPSGAIPFIEKAVYLTRKAGLLSCLKHFPGLGASRDDPHSKIARADFDMQTFLNREALTFKAGVDAGADMVMTTHMVLPRIDSRIATESEVIINALLRDKLNFDGVVITDDLLMDGSAGLGGYGERAERALIAGHDILLFGANHQATREAVTHLKKAYRNNQLDENRLRISLDRVSGIKSKLAVSAL